LDKELNPTAHQLRLFLDSYPDHSELFITDRYGATMAATGQFSDYFQADEEWWLAAWNNGQGGAYISAPEFDESAGVTASLIALPILDSETGELLGIIRSTLILDELFALLAQPTLNQNQYPILFDSSGTLLLQPRLIQEELLTNLWQNIPGDSSYNVVVDPQKKNEFIFGYARLMPLTELAPQARPGGVSKLEEQITAAVNGLGWTTVILEEQEGALIVVNLVAQGIQLVGLVTTFLAGILAMLFATSVTRPLQTLSSAAAQIGEGNWDVLLLPTGKDEIGLFTDSLEQISRRFRELIRALTERSEELEKKNKELQAENYQRKRLEKALQKSRERFQFLSEVANEGIAIHENGIILEGNSALGRIFGYEPNELLGMKTLNLVMPVSRRLMRQHLISGEEGPYLALAKRKNGSVIYIEVQGSLAYYEGQEVRVTVIRDITARKIIEEKLENFSNQLQTAAELVKELNAILDLDELLRETVSLLQSRFALYHVHIYLIFDTKKENEGKRLVMHSTSALFSNDKSKGNVIALNQTRSLVARAARERDVIVVNDVYTDPTFLPSPHLPEIRSEMAVPLMTASRLLGVLELQDNRPNRFTEGELDIFNTLAAQIAISLENAQLFDEINKAAEKLRDMDRLKSDFLANMSHELRTPLNSILGYSEIMLMGINGPLNDASREDIEAIRSSGYHLLRLINDILDLAKIEAGRMALAIEDIDINGILQDIYVQHSALVRDKEVELVLDSELNLPNIFADPLRVRQILTNLVSNAIKFTDEGKVYLRASCDGEGEWLSLEVEDEGIGIEQSDIDKIFEEFRQVDGSLTRRAEGTGLGLAITLRLVQMHGGLINVESEFGKGSTFTVKLPVRQEQKRLRKATF
jgi:PAS domain S-box-containing protein